MTARTGYVDHARGAATRPATAALLLLIVYLALSALTDPSGYLGTDTGTKVLTLEVMEREGTFSPDIGYWAEDLDPSGSLHPVHQMEQRPDGSWVGVTTLPMLGGLAAAFGARAISRRLDPASDGWAAYWVIGLGSPIVVYSLDFWEHSVGVACVLWAGAALLGVLGGHPPWTAALAGVLLGSGAVLRQEILIYTLVAVTGTCCVLALRRRVADAAVAGASAVIGFALPWFANGALEQSVQGQSRTERSTGAAAAVVGSGSAGSTVDDRAREGLQTLVGLVAGDAVFSALLGVGVVAAVVVAARASARGDAIFAKVALGAAGAIYFADAVGGLGYVPGLLSAFPLAIGGLLVWRDERCRPLVVVALAALPLVYAFQYLGGAPPQWGGRYTLASGSLLGIAALTGLRRRLPIVLRGLVALSVLVSGLGVAWLVERSHGSADFFEVLGEEAEPVVIARQAFLLREGGAAVLGRRWLSVENEAEFARAVEVAREVGERRFTVLEWDGPAPPEASLPTDVEEVRRVPMTFVNTPVGMVTYEFTD